MLVLFLLTGCAQRIYRPSNMPSEFVAPPPQQYQELGIERLQNISSSETIACGDVLEVSVVTDFGQLGTVIAPVRVGGDGHASVPLIGRVHLAGLDLEEADQAIVAAGIDRGIFRNPHVTVTMKRQRTNRIAVMGAVEEQGVYELPRGGSSLLGAIVAAGGLTEDAGPEVEIRRAARPGPPGILPPTQERFAENGATHPASYETPVGNQAKVIRVNLLDGSSSAAKTPLLTDGDVVHVPRRDNRSINVIGLVHKPGQFEMPPGQEVRLLDALALAGGRTLSVADKVLIIRKLADEAQPIVIQASVRKAKHSGQDNVRLLAGDVVSVEETPETLIVGTLTRVMHFGVSGSVPLF